MCNSDPKLKLGEESNKIMQAFVANYPQMAKVMQDQATPFAQADLAASKATYPGETELGINTASSNINGAGGKLAGEALALDQAANPEFYSTRSAASNKLGDLFKSIDLTGALSGSEQSQIERGVNRGNINSGNGTNNSPLNAINAGMMYGDAANTRKLQQQGVATGAVGAAAGFLPSSVSKIDPFQIASGAATKPGGNPGLATSAGLGGQLQGSLANTSGAIMNNNLNAQTGLEKFLGMMPSYSG